MIPTMNYELFMGEALAEARLAVDHGERPIAAVAVVNDAMVARAHDRVQETNDPTAHAVVVALREAARRLGSSDLSDATIFATRGCRRRGLAHGPSSALAHSTPASPRHDTPSRRSGRGDSTLRLRLG